MTDVMNLLVSQTRNGAAALQASCAGTVGACAATPIEKHVIFPEKPPSGMRIFIETAVSQVFNVAQNDLRNTTRGPANVAQARQVAMYLAHVGLGLNLTQVGRVFGRDRTTVSHACGVVEDRRDDPNFDRALELLEWVIDAQLSRHFEFVKRQ